VVDAAAEREVGVGARPAQVELVGGRAPAGGVAVGAPEHGDDEIAGADRVVGQLDLGERHPA
jgi:hypothetical protein